ncbi:MAG: hypothetical protein H6667_23645 [Ardenticatenaceae bacterium]|nr:hypothetical protein [Ardenticatenaceae bacterium]MCB9445860.1 hypothetical protein [Ardenticatenaceae bacterium]
MNKQNTALAAAVAASLFLLVFLIHNAASSSSEIRGGDTAVAVPPPDKRTITSFYSLIYGPTICTDFGDPFSPWNSPWAPGSYTYHYRIIIPDDYPDDVLRVELFDPDSINRASNTAEVFHTVTAVNAGFPLFETQSCTEDQRFSCLLDTGELALTTGEPPLDFASINPFWLVRVDENRGAGTPPGNGTCGIPANYNTAFNTSTLFQLFYYAQNSDGTISKIPLSIYTGQVGDGLRDNGNHQTDLHWVSPGGTRLYDQPAYVPVDLGSFGDFELSIVNDLPSIMIDPYTNKRTIYLDITSLQGASGNGFDLWAGPLYLDISSDANVRNVQLVDDPLAHDAHGVFIEPLGIQPIHSAYEYPYEMPLLYIDARLAGESVYISLFDTDAGTQPPITFYFDTIPEEDWSLSFGDGDPDPDGVSGRCKPGSCNNIWVNPAYEIKIPGILDNCDWENPTPEDCTPFYGGYLMVRYNGGLRDTHVWQIPVVRPQATVEPEHSQIDTTPGILATHVFTTTWLENDWMSDLAVTDSTWPAQLDWSVARDPLGVARGTITVTVTPPDILWISDTFTLTLSNEPLATGTTRTTWNGLFLPQRVYLPLVFRPQ